MLYDTYILANPNYPNSVVVNAPKISSVNWYEVGPLLPLGGRFEPGSVHEPGSFFSLIYFFPWYLVTEQKNLQ